MIPVILLSDKTQLMLFRGKVAYPVYITIGNIPKAIRCKPSRHAQLLIAYLPVSKLRCLTSEASRRHALANIFHLCMQTIVAPISVYGETGIAMMSGDGGWRRCHPIFAAFVGDYPEQTLVTCTYNGQCPKCIVPADELGAFFRYPLRNYHQAQETFLLVDRDVHVFHAACRDAGVKPVFHPFWEHLPLTDIFIAITPDILHQMLQGVMKHLIAWLTSTAAFGPDEIDARCQALPPNHHVRIFPNGITTLSRVLGQEHKDIARLLLGLIVDQTLSSRQVPSRIVRAVQALLDFLYIAQFPSQTTTTIIQLEESLAQFHDNKDVFLDLGVRAHFNIPKLHSLVHYSGSISLFGSTDNYNTKQTEQLHIDLTKDAYHASNCKNEYFQMTTWLERHEKVQQHAAFLEWRQRAGQEHGRTSEPIEAPKPIPRSVKMAHNPSAKAVSFDDLARKYGAIDFQDALADFVAHINHPDTSAAARRTRAADMLIPFWSVPIYHKIKFTSNHTSEIIDVVHVRPEQGDAHGCVILPRFDTVIVCGSSQARACGNSGKFEAHW